MGPRDGGPRGGEWGWDSTPPERTGCGKPGEGSALSLLVVVVRAAHWLPSVIVSGGVVAVVRLLARNGEVDP